MTCLFDVRPADAPLIATLFEQSFIEAFGHLYAPEDLAAFLATKTQADFAREIGDPTFHFQLASRDADPVGFVKLGPPDFPVETPPATIELRQLYVLDRATGQGFGARLMDWATAAARATGAEHLQLSVYIDNHRARCFYERRGFTAIASYKFMVGNHADEDLIMRLAL